MLRYVALAFLLFGYASSTPPTPAAGNIGCLFSETLCNQEKEWCYDDYAFGRCLSLYGSVREAEMHRYELGTSELHGLELEMQRLFLLGYRWSHTYTQCVLQALLRAIRKKIEFDVGNCNAELDQDLEGALKAIEGEEMEHIDPNKLAIVRFAPSVINPHSSYADELYYPPIEEMLPPFRGGKEANEIEKSSPDEVNEREKPHKIEEPKPNPKSSFLGMEGENPQQHFSNSINDQILSMPPAAIPMYQDSQPYPIDFGNYDYDLPPYESFPKPVYKRNGYNSGPFNYGELGYYYKKPAIRPSNEIKVLSNMLSDRSKTRYYGKKTTAPYNYHTEDEKNEIGEGYFNESPSVPFFSERPFNPFMAFRKNSVNAPHENQYRMRGSKAATESELPELSIPNEEDVPETIHAGFVKEFADENYQNDQENNNLKNYKYGSPSYNNGENIGNFNGKDSNNNYNWKNDVNNYNDEVNSYPMFKNINDGQGLVHPNDGIPQDTMYYERGDYPAAYYDYDYYPNYADYGNNYMDVGGGSDDDPLNLHRAERLDVKKPGPNINSHNNFGFNDYPTNPHSWISKLDTKDGDALLVDRLRGNYDGKQLKNGQYPDLMLTDGGFVGKDGVRMPPNHGYPMAAHQVSKADRKIFTRKQNEQDSYVYITLSGKQISDKLADQLIHLIVSPAPLNLDMKYISNLRVDNNQVMFQVKENNKNVTAAQLAELTEELRHEIKAKTGLEIVQAGVGTKSALSAVVYSSGQRQMFTAAAIVCGVCAAFLVAATVLYFVRQNSRSKAKLQGLTAHDTEASKDYQDLCRSRMSSKGDGKDTTGGNSVGTTGGSNAPGQRISSLSKDSENGNKSPSSRSSTSSWSEEPVMSNMDISTGHMVLSYMEDHLKNKDRLDQEWVALCAYEAEPCATTTGFKPENAQKNRYPDIMPYDHNRVILNDRINVSGSNYVNASSITDHDPRNPAYIATQGPLASTAADFWQLVWEQGSVVIVMLTRLTENGTTLCHRYWPEEGSELYHIYEVHLVSEHIWCDDYLVRSFYLKNAKTGETRTVTQFHFLSWPESGIPASTKALLEFRRKVNKSYRGRSCPIIVHCSDGIGRTGTYCLIDMVLNRMAKGAKEIDIAATLEHIRDQKPTMVKTKTQFEFVLMAVAEEVHAILKALPQ